MFQCWKACLGNGSYCLLHTKMRIEEIETLIKNWCKKAGIDKWKLFIEKVQKSSRPEDLHKLIELDIFASIVQECLDVKLTKEQKSLFFNTSGRVNNGKQEINISLIYSTKFLMEVEKMYNRLKIQDNEVDDAVD